MDGAAERLYEDPQGLPLARGQSFDRLTPSTRPLLAGLKPLQQQYEVFCRARSRG